MQQDATLQRLLQEDGEHLIQGVRLLGQAALLLLKKIALCEEGLARLVTDQDTQRRVLTELTGRLDLHRRAYERRQRITQVVHEAARMAEVALQFEAYMRDHLGPLQGLLEQVVRVDGDLYHAVTEIEDLTRQLLQQQRLTTLPGGAWLDERWLTFLSTSQLKKERLVEMWEHLERQDGQMEALDIDMANNTSETVSPVLTLLANIRTLVEARLAPLVPVHATAPPEQLGEEGGLPRMSVTDLATRLVDRFGMEFVLVAPGTFQMGSERGLDDEKPVHTVHITRPFYLGIYPVTQRQWEAIMGSNPSKFRGAEHPVEQVSWEKTQEFIRSLNTHAGHPGYRLPTEAEWEYAARAGSTGDYCFDDAVGSLGPYAWCADNAGGTTHPVGQLQPNAWGLYDMHGHVWEWVQDWYSDYAAGTALDPTGPTGGDARVLRGSSWADDGRYAHSARRYAIHPGGRFAGIGFRLAQYLS
jgi:formylglycine-generating enzyme required for sulfatase activity